MCFKHIVLIETKSVVFLCLEKHQQTVLTSTLSSCYCQKKNCALWTQAAKSCCFKKQVSVKENNNTKYCHFPLSIDKPEKIKYSEPNVKQWAVRSTVFSCCLSQVVFSDCPFLRFVLISYHQIISLR